MSLMPRSGKQKVREVLHESFTSSTCTYPRGIRHSRGAAPSKARRGVARLLGGAVVDVVVYLRANLPCRHGKPCFRRFGAQFATFHLDPFCPTTWHLVWQFQVVKQRLRHGGRWSSIDTSAIKVLTYQHHFHWIFICCAPSPQGPFEGFYVDRWKIEKTKLTV
jgi:hypothetical protein